jgi:hypothetical protein
MTRKIKKIFLSLTGLSLLGYSKIALAVSTDPRAGLESGANTAGYNVMSKPTFQSVLVVIIRYALGFIGIIFIALIMIAAFQWMTSGGNEDKIKKAKSHLLNAVIGLAIIFMAYAITWFVADVMNKATTPGYYSY